MKILKPHPLKRGDVIGLAAPASPPPLDLLSRGVRYLEHLGYRIEMGYHLYQQYGYLAGTDSQRASDLHQLFAHPKVNAIFCVRGGHGSMRLLPLLDYRMISQNPKILVGYSDITALQCALFEKCGLVSFSGPMVSSEMGTRLSGKAEELFWRSLTTARRLSPISLKRVRKEGSRHGNVTGRLIGGNLSVLAALAGTMFLPKGQDLVLLLEEISEKPYRIDRMLQQLRIAGAMDSVRAMVLGRFIDCVADQGKPSFTYEETLDGMIGELGIPALRSLHYGHIHNPLTLPLGVRVKVTPSTGKLEFLESALADM